jgi:hypothetical protein
MLRRIEADRQKADELSRIHKLIWFSKVEKNFVT